MNQNQSPMLVIIGPTASGKTRLAVQLAARLNGEIISIDSRQVYRHMNIGTGKDYNEYMVNGAPVPYHLIDIMDAGSRYNLHAFSSDFNNALALVNKNNQLPVLCGGTGLYLQAALGNLAYSAVPVNEQLRSQLLNLDAAQLKHYFNNLPQSAYKTLADLSTTKRSVRAIEICSYLLAHPGYEVNQKTPPNACIIGLNPPLDLRRLKISTRLKARLDSGLIAEVESLQKAGLSPSMLEYYGLEYKFVSRYLQGQMTKEALFELLEIAIQQFAKRQMTWFRKMEREGFKINWLLSQTPDEQFEEALQIYQKI